MVPYPVALWELAEKGDEKLEVAIYKSQYVFRRVCSDALKVGWFGTVRRRRVRKLILKDHTSVIPYGVVFGILFEKF